jgi:hypothetical protein
MTRRHDPVGLGKLLLAEPPAGGVDLRQPRKAAGAGNSQTGRSRSRNRVPGDQRL